MNIDKYKKLNLEEYNKLISQNTIIQTEKEVVYQGIKYELSDEDYYKFTYMKNRYGYDSEYFGNVKNKSELEDINKSIILAFRNIIEIIEDDKKYNTETIQKK